MLRRTKSDCYPKHATLQNFQPVTSPSKIIQTSTITYQNSISDQKSNNNEENFISKKLIQGEKDNFYLNNRKHLINNKSSFADVEIYTLDVNCLTTLQVTKNPTINSYKNNVNNFKILNHQMERTSSQLSQDSQETENGNDTQENEIPRTTSQLQNLMLSPIQPIYAHKAILSSKSPVFAILFFQHQARLEKHMNSRKYTNDTQIIINERGEKELIHMQMEPKEVYDLITKPLKIYLEYRSEVVLTVLDFIYTNCCQLSYELLPDVLDMSIAFGLKDLSNTCIKYAKSLLNAQTQTQMNHNNNDDRSSINSSENYRSDQLINPLYIIQLAEISLNSSFKNYVAKNVIKLLTPRHFENRDALSILSVEAFRAILSSDDLHIDELKLIEIYLLWCHLSNYELLDPANNNNRDNNHGSIRKQDKKQLEKIKSYKSSRANSISDDNSIVSDDEPGSDGGGQNVNVNEVTGNRFSEFGKKILRKTSSLKRQKSPNKLEIKEKLSMSRKDSTNSQTAQNSNNNGNNSNSTTSKNTNLYNFLRLYLLTIQELKNLENLFTREDFSLQTNESLLASSGFASNAEPNSNYMSNNTFTRGSSITLSSGGTTSNQETTTNYFNRKSNALPGSPSTHSRCSALKVDPMDNDSSSYVLENQDFRKQNNNNNIIRVNYRCSKTHFNKYLPCFYINKGINIIKFNNFENLVLKRREGSKLKDHFDKLIIV